MLHLLQSALPMFEQVAVLFLDLLASLAGEVVLQKGEVGAEAHDELFLRSGTSQSWFSSCRVHFLLYLRPSELSLAVSLLLLLWI